MASFDIESIGPQLRKIKISQLEPDLLVGVLELAEEHGYEVTITSSTNLQFLFKIYQAEKVKERQDLKRLKKAENLITRLAIIYSLHHETQQRENKTQGEERKPRIQQSIMDEEMRISKKIRDLFESVGISDGREMQETIGLLGESKIEERIEIIKKTSLGGVLIKSVFGEHPEVLRIIKDDDFLEELKAMESKMRVIDAWKDSANKSPPVWADYGQSPSVLLVDYQNISHGLDITSSTISEEHIDDVSDDGVPQDTSMVAVHELLEGLGFKLISKETELVLERADGRVLTISNPKNGEYDPVAIRTILSNFGLRVFPAQSGGNEEREPEQQGKEKRLIRQQEKTSPAAPSSMSGEKKPRKENTENSGKKNWHHLNSLENSKNAKDAYIEAGGGVSGMLAAIQELGVDIKDLNLEIESISEDSDVESRSREQARFDSSISFLFDLIFTNKLEKTINSNLGMTGLSIGKIRYIVGASGAFELQIVDEKRNARKCIYLSLQDMEPAKIGKEAVEAEGMISYRIWTENLEIGDSTSGGRKHALLEDARDIGNRGRIRIRTPRNLEFEDVTTISAAVLKEDLVLRPNPDSELHQEYYRSLANSSVRKVILRSLLAYFEMSRRTLLPDRRAQNTYLLQVQKSNGKREFTFQPMDMDGIGNFIDSNDDEPDFSEFNNDFYKAAVDFSVHTHEGMLRAARKNMIRSDNIPRVSEIFFEIVAEAKKPFDLDSEMINANRREVLVKNDGKMIGIGFDAAQFVGQTIPSHGGRATIIRPDGRVQLEAAIAVLTAARAGTLMKQLEFIDGLERGGAERMAKLPKKAVDIVKLIVETRENDTYTETDREEKIQRLRSHSGGEIAFLISENQELANEENEEIRIAIAERLAKEIIFGKDSPVSIVDQEVDDVIPVIKRDITKLERASR